MQCTVTLHRITSRIFEDDFEDDDDFDDFFEDDDFPEMDEEKRQRQHRS